MNKRRLRKAIKRLQKLPGNRYLFLYAINKLKHFYLKLIRSDRVAYPSTIMLELTNLCNLSCTTCPREYDYGREMDMGKMPVENSKRIIGQMWPYLDSIGLTGMGETFMYNEIEEVTNYIRAKNKGIIISVSTNAVIPHFIEKVTPLINNIDTIQISTDGLGEVYEKIRRGASFATLDTNIRKLSELCFQTETDLMLNMVVTKENYLQMPRMVKYALETGVRYMDFTLFNLASVTGIESSYYDFYKSAEFLDVVSDLERVIKETPGVTVTGRNFSTASGFRKCPFPWTHFYVCWNGYMPPCCAKPFPKEMNFGNVFDTDLLSVLNSSEYREFRHKWYLNETPDFCKKCHFIGIEPIRRRSGEC